VPSPTPGSASNAPRTLLLTLVFAPDSVSTAIIVTELARQLHAKGHEMIVMTTTPHYNEDPDSLAAQPLRPRWGSWLQQSDYQGIPVFHARVAQKGSRVIKRLLDYFGFHVLSTLGGLWYGGRYRIVLAPSPPLTIGFSAMLLAWARRARFVYNVQEIYPDIAVSLGMLKNGLLIRLLESAERFIYARAAKVVVISERFRGRLLAKGVPAEKLCVIPNFVDVDVITPRPRRNGFSSAHGLDDRFVILYAGNIGLTQDFDTMLAAAERLKDRPEICFLIVGDGARRTWLAGRIAALPSPNVRLLPYQPRGSVPDLYATADVCLVPMLGGTAHDTFPSKIYTIMAAGRPAIVCADAGSELARVVEETGCGTVVTPGDPEALAAAVRESRDRIDAWRARGLEARQYVVRHHSPAVVAQQYHDLLAALDPDRPRP
jgi:colanic acid biosynthesis glycosyl transferase WcaI